MVDFEYGGANCAAYDIGNHFCEFAGHYYSTHLLFTYRNSPSLVCIHQAVCSNKVLNVLLYLVVMFPTNIICTVLTLIM